MAELTYRQQMFELLDQQVDEQFERIVKELNLSPAAVVDRMLDGVHSHQYSDQMGSFYDTASVMRLLGGVSRQAISERAKNRTILRVTTADNKYLYPAFQFANREVRPELREVFILFRAAPVDGWAIAEWLTSPAASLGGKTPKQVLDADPENVTTILPLAAETANRWSAP